MQYTISGDRLPLVEINLEAGQRVSGSMGDAAWMSGGIELTPSIKLGISSGFGGMKRIDPNNPVTYGDYVAKTGPGSVTFCARLPGQIININLGAGQMCIVHREGLLCAAEGVTSDIQAYGPLGGEYGDKPFILQKLTGPGDVFIALAGEVVSRTLQPDETLQVHPGHLGMIGANVRCDMIRLRSLKGTPFGADGVPLLKLTGPGRVWLQSMSVAGLALTLPSYMAKPEPPPSRPGMKPQR